MQVEIITIGDELLIGQVIDTNSAWMGQQLNKSGFLVKIRTAVGDTEDAIIHALNIAKTRADIILITGGLGPTKDDLTKNVLCKYFNSNLIFNEAVYKEVEALFKARNREVTPVNRLQAMVPDNCTVVPNKNGTAPGMWFEENGKIFVSMPGVPFEMTAMMTDFVIPELEKRFNTPNIIHKTIMTQGAGESFLSELIEKWEDSLPKHIKLAYLPSPGMVRLRLTGVSHDADLLAEMEMQINAVMPLIENYVYGYDDEKIEELVGRLLREKNQTVATAESCTGGFISHSLTTIPGSSDYYIGSVIAYANEIKTEVLGIDKELIAQHGAVSEPVVKQMAEAIRKKMNTTYGIATSGIAGPGGGTAEKPIGTVWIAVSNEQETITKKFMLGRDRLRIIQVAGMTALNILRKQIIKS